MQKITNNLRRPRYKRELVALAKFLDLVLGALRGTAIANGMFKYQLERSPPAQILGATSTTSML